MGEHIEDTYEAAVVRYERFMANIKSKEKDGWKYVPERRKLVQLEEDGTEITISVEPPPEPSKEKKPGATRALGKAEVMTMEHFINNVVDPNPDKVDSSKYNSSQPEQRYVFNTLKDSRLAADFKVPDLLQKATNLRRGAFTQCNHPGNYDFNQSGMFEFFMGPAGSGAYLHAHAAAWNGIVHGRKRWLMVSPGKLQDTNKLPAGQVPSFEWYKSSYPIWREQLGSHLVEFIQEEGELVFVPDLWGHAIINLEPTVGISKQIGTFAWPEGIPDVIRKEMREP